ncbi:calmodulin-lysine N-methyltransferase [Paragonimus westermani]|uniref:Calmodulin-lysine N-methyltransferase n=1 Tax=Paragonimus westermani TaxID=34504 RepID=A0A5J4NSE0_9TREM|nr:calmodulin-lysine N-methyltransferase [Paragonimus westermani]
MLTGFDNTGNVSIWSSELLLAHAMFVPCLYPGLWELLTENRKLFKRVCELGAGMTGATGLSISLCPLLNPDYVLLTDGNRRCVDSLYATLAHHLTRIAQNRYGIRMEVLQLTWPYQMNSSVELPSIHLSHSFQLIVASDCLFDTTGHIGLLELIDQLLCNDLSATFLAVAPLRGQTLMKFISLAELCGKWSLVRLEPNDYMSHELAAYIYEGLSEMEENLLRDKFVGQLIVMRRISKV